jgi:hypothetical protein
MLKGYYTELVFVKVYGAQGNDSEESIPPAYVSRRAGTTYNDIGLPCRGPAGNRFLGSIKGLQIRAQAIHTKELTVT